MYRGTTYKNTNNESINLFTINNSNYILVLNYLYYHSIRYHLLYSIIHIKLGCILLGYQYIRETMIFLVT